jgi:CelD/BcsL family acetyltransferase involved in cellulose biosynthesis
VQSIKKRMGLSFELFRGREGLEQLAPSWTALADSLPGARFVHYPQWYRSYLASLEPNPQLVQFVAAYRDGGLIGVLPLQFQSKLTRWLRPRILGTIEHDEMQSSDFIFARTTENADLVYQLVRWLRRQSTLTWHELRLRKVRADSAIAHCMRSHSPKATVALCHDGSGYFNTGGSFEQATAEISGSFKRNLRRLAKRAASDAPLRFESYRRLEDLEAAFATFVDIEASGWKGDSGSSSAIRCRPEMFAFYKTLVAEYGAGGACVINILWHGDTAVAGQFCLKTGSTLNVLKIGFSDAHSSFAPGNLLLERTIQRACEDPETDIVSLVNQPSWAKAFKPLNVGVWSYCAPNWNIQGTAVHMGLLIKRVLDNRARARGEVPATSAEPEMEASVSG